MWLVFVGLQGLCVFYLIMIVILFLVFGILYQNQSALAISFLHLQCFPFLRAFLTTVEKM